MYCLFYIHREKMYFLKGFTTTLVIAAISSLLVINSTNGMPAVSIEKVITLTIAFA